MAVSSTLGSGLRKGRVEMYRIQFSDEISPDPSIVALLIPMVESACARHNLNQHVQVIITTDRHMQFLNSTFRDRCEPTDVLSFDLSNGADFVLNTALSSKLWTCQLFTTEGGEEAS